MKTRKMVLTALFIAMVTVTTFIGIRTPGTEGGYIHLGTLTMFTIALKFGPKYGALSGGLGMALFDIIGGFPFWALATFIIRLISGFVVGYIAISSKGQGENFQQNVLGILLGGVIIIIGYFIFEAFVIGVGWAALSSSIGNTIQIIIALSALYIIRHIPHLEDLEN